MAQVLNQNSNQSPNPSLNKSSASPLLFNLNHDVLMFSLLQNSNIEVGEFQQRQFPDGETYLKVDTDCRQRECCILVDFSNPNPAYLPALFLSDTLRHLGARRVGLIAPYLPYMRQDIRFQPGEALTSASFAREISQRYDYLITMDPHLHRYKTLSEIYSIPDMTLQGAPALANWLKQKQNLLLVGPDEESEQWVGAIGEACGHPHVVGKKNRQGDRQVSIQLPDLSQYFSRRPVIVDDVIASGETILECGRALAQQGFESCDCLAVHGIFADGIDSRIKACLKGELLTSNTIPHSSNRVDISPIIRDALITMVNNRAQ